MSTPVFIGVMIVYLVIFVIAIRQRIRGNERVRELKAEIEQDRQNRAALFRANSHIAHAEPFTFSVKINGAWKDGEAQSFSFVNDSADAFRWLTENINNSADAASDMAMGLDAIEADDEWLEPFEKWADEHKEE